MSLFLRKKKKNNVAELVKSSKALLQSIITDEKLKEKLTQANQEELSKNIAQMRGILENPNLSKGEVEKIMHFLIENDTISIFIQNLEKLLFDCRRNFSMIFNTLLNYDLDGTCTLHEHIKSTPSIIDLLFEKYPEPAVMVNIGMIILECIKSVDIARYILYSKNFYIFFEFLGYPNFDLSSNSFGLFKAFFRHKKLVRDFLLSDFDNFFTRFEALLETGSYVIRRLCMKFLGEIILDEEFSEIMKIYITRPQSLKLVMIMMNEKKKSIRFEAFHVFKVFVANPAKTEAILKILRLNKQKLLDFFSTFLLEKEEDAQFKDEKENLCDEIRRL